MQLSSEQERARSAILAWYRSPNRKPWFYFQGPAGSGKTSVITATTDCIKGQVIYLAPTAKSALVMRRRGCENPRTVHSVIYRPKGISGDRKQIEQLRALMDIPTTDPKAKQLRDKLLPLLAADLKKLEGVVEAGKLNRPGESNRVKALKLALSTGISNPRDLITTSPLFEVNEESDVREAALIVCDEISMCSQKMVEDILSFGVPLLAQGDPYQLPPVMAQAYFANQEPDFLLTEVHRQAKDSPIIHLATLAREGKKISVGDYGNCKVTNQSDAESAMAADQILVGTHKQRWRTIDMVRKLQGHLSVLPEIGEKVICKDNNPKMGLINGDSFTITLSEDVGTRCKLGLQNEDIDTVVYAWKDYFLRKEPNPWTKKDAACITHGAATTVHSAQGSQYPFVYVIDESSVFGADSKRHRYTAFTRASEKLVVRV